MKFSCIMTTYNDGALVRQSVQSVLNQTFEDFELLIVDDGSAAETKELLDTLDDPRIRILPQANDGLSSARNRGLHHVRGDYVCFLDADDTRAPWAFAEVASEIDRTGAELVFVRGALSEGLTQLGPFLDETHFDGYQAECRETGEDGLSVRKAWAATLEPQSANKFISRDLIERGSLRFPNDHFFEDILFHTLAIAHAQSIKFLGSRNYTYFQRQMRPQLTGSRDQIRFDILGTARVTFQMFRAHPDFSNPRQRGAVAISVLRLLHWCESLISTSHKFAFRVALEQVLRNTDPMYFVIDENTPDPRGDAVDLIRFARGLVL